MHLQSRTAPWLALLAGCAAAPALAQSNQQLQDELKALRERVEQLEQKLQQQAAPAAGQWGMTPEQQRELNRIAVKAEALDDNAEAAGFKGLKISGVLDPTYIVNRNQRTASLAFLNNIAGASEVFAYDNSYFGWAVIDFQKELEGGTRWRLTLAPSKSVGSNYNFPSIVHEASVSLPITDLQTRWWAGQIPDWSGYEYYLANQTKFITHNMMFDFLAPTYYTALGTDITSGKWQVKTALGNMNASRNNPDPASGAALRRPMASLRVDYAKGEFDGWGSALQFGHAANNVAGGWSQLVNGEVDAYFIRGDLTLQGQFNYGTQKLAAYDGGDSRWWGLSTLAAYKLTPRLEVSARLDYLDNSRHGGGTFNLFFTGDSSGALVAPDGRNGFGPGMVRDDASGTWAVVDPHRGANRSALALGVNYLLAPNTTLKAEYRYDRASLPVFVVLPEGSWRKDNQLLGASAVVSF
jgi:hypothetical protein